MNKKAKREKRAQNYPESYKKEAVKLSEQTERTLSQVARELGIGNSTLHKWRNRYGQKGQEQEVVIQSKESLEKEIKRLLKENEVLKMEREILKKAATFFAKETSR